MLGARKPMWFRQEFTLTELKRDRSSIEFHSSYIPILLRVYNLFPINYRLQVDIVTLAF